MKNQFLPFFTVSQRSVNTGVRTDAGRESAIHFTAELRTIEINPIQFDNKLVVNILRAQEDVNTIFLPKQKKVFFQYHENALHGFYMYMLRNEQGNTWLILLLRLILFHDIGVKYTVIQLKEFRLREGEGL